MENYHLEINEVHVKRQKKPALRDVSEAHPEV